MIEDYQKLKFENKYLSKLDDVTLSSEIGNLQNFAILNHTILNMFEMLFLKHYFKVLHTILNEAFCPKILFLISLKNFFSLKIN